MATKRGDLAREAVRDKILNTFEGSFVQDKKIYIFEKDGNSNEVIQFAITITMPKTPINASGNTNALESVSPVVTQLSSEDEAQIEKLEQKLREAGLY